MFIKINKRCVALNSASEALKEKLLIYSCCRFGNSFCMCLRRLNDKENKKKKQKMNFPAVKFAKSIGKRKHQINYLTFILNLMPEDVFGILPSQERKKVT